MDETDTRMMRRGGEFPQTSWGLIRLARDPDAPAYRASLEALMKKYWGPVYLFVRRSWSRDTEEAKDRTQSFFLAFLEKGFLGSVEAEKGRFRSFVRAALKHFLTKQKRDERALKRRPPGGILSLEAEWERGKVIDPPAREGVDPDDEFRDAWRRAVLEAALQRLRLRAQESGKEVCVELMAASDLDYAEGKKPSYDELAQRFSLTQFQVTNGLHWARKEFKGLVLREIEDQVATRNDLKEEARELFGIEVE